MSCRHPPGVHARTACVRSFAVLVFAFVFACLPLAAAAEGAPPLRLSGHVLPALAQAQPAKAASSDESLSLTIVLRRTDSAGFEQFLKDVYDPSSAQFHAFPTPAGVSDRFGPSAADYATVRAYFVQQGFAVDDDSPNRLTLTVRGARTLIESALHTEILDYEIGGESFHANASDPALPADVAARVETIAGLSNLASPQPLREVHIAIFSAVCAITATFNANFVNAPSGSDAARLAYLRAFAKCVNQNSTAAGYGKLIAVDPPPPAWQGVDGTGQTIGLLEFDSFQASDVSDYIQLIDLPASTIDHVTTVPVGGGTSPGPNQDEVLLDLADVLSIAPGATVKVYVTQFGGGSSYQAMFNAMINGGVTIISNSWAYCEDQTTLADVQSIDSILQAAAASGISVFSGSGDSGSTCLDGGANTASVPASAPHITAVGGTSFTLGAGNTYGSETWWNGSSDTPPTGQGGFGTSRFFTRPSYQDGFTASTMRSIPDVAANADPEHGVQICAAALGGCPTGAFYGGTSSSAPMWAAFAALLNQAQGQNLGFLNAAMYPLGSTSSFHSASSMGSDFAHVGLGSPNLARLHQRLTNQSFGSVDGSVSGTHAFSDGNFTFPADLGLPIYVTGDGVATAWIAVRVADSNGNAGGGLPVSLAASAGSHAVITPPSGTTNADTGTFVFAVTDTTFEALTFTATANGTVIDSTASVTFVAPPAAGASIMAFPTSVPADAVTPTAITVTLRDADNHPSPGKYVTLSQTGRSTVTGPDLPVTDANGEIVFTATDGIEETVTYTAVDNTDGDLPIPGSAEVTFSGSVAGSCAVPATPVGPDYTVTPYINGFAAYPFFYGNVNWGCRGAGNPAFSANGDVFVSHFPTGNLYKFGIDGGSAATPLSNLGPALDNLRFGLDGKLYATHGATTGDFTTGNVIEIDPDTGAQIRVVVSNVTCPNGLAVDPLSGDLFFLDPCFGAGSDNASLTRIVNPSGPTPTTEVYATLPSTPNGVVAFAPDGTIYLGTAYGSTPSQVYQVTGTDQAQPALLTPVDGVASFYWVNVAHTLPSGAAQSLFALGLADVGSHAQLNIADITTNPPTLTPVAYDIGCSTIGQDGCLYSSSADTVYKIAPASGVCDFTGTNRSPSLVLGPATANATQGDLQTLTAVFRNADMPADTSVFFQIDGANAQTRLVRTAADGTATLEYQGTFAGNDSISAFATFDSMTLTSNVAKVAWGSGPHETFLSIYGPGGGTAGQPVALAAALVDIAVNPRSAIAGASLHFAVGGQSCDASTAANGTASCTVTLATPGAYTLTISYPGSTQYLPISESTIFVVPTDGIDLIFADGFDGD